MKRISEIAIVSLMLMVLIPFSTNGKSINPASGFERLLIVNDDTTGLINRLMIDTFNLPVIPPSSGVQFYKDRIVFLSMSKYEKKMAPNQISFGAIEAYTASVLDSVTGRHSIFSPLSSFSYPCDAMTFTPKYDSVYFTGLAGKTNREKIFLAKFTTNSKGQSVLIKDEKPLEFCSDNYNYSHPTLSNDGKMMVFASDRAGSSGGMDLYLSRKESGRWTPPENLGNLINTSGNEFFPFLDSQNNLFFSSDKLPGFGGYDIFTCRFNGKGWEKPVNLSGRINSVTDEIAFTMDKTDSRTAFFTRRNPSGNREMKLFVITLKKEGSFQNAITISSVFNETPLAPATIVAAKTDIPDRKTEVKKEAELQKSDDFRITTTKPVTETAKKEEVKVINAPANTVKPAEKDITPKTAPPVNREVSKPETKITEKPVIPASSEQVTYRVQLLPDAVQRKSGVFMLNGTSYKIFEYTYLGAVRYTIGEFSTLAPAVALQRLCRQSGFPQSFVVAFKNNTRSLDPGLFK